MEKIINVGAAIIRRNGKILICSRPPNTPLADFFEFPGGKFEEGETPAQCIEREILEELGIRIHTGEYVTEIFHTYPDKSVHVVFYFAEMCDPEAELKPLDHQTMKWVHPADLTKERLLPADLPVAQLLSRK